MDNDNSPGYLGAEELFDPKGDFTAPATYTTLGMHWKLRDSRLKRGMRLTLFALINRSSPHEEKGWTCWPSIDVLAADMCLARRTIQRALPELEKRGLVSIKHRGHISKTNIYRLREENICRLRSRFVA